MQNKWDLCLFVFLGVVVVLKFLKNRQILLYGIIKITKTGLKLVVFIF